MAPTPKKKHTRRRSNLRKNAVTNRPTGPTLVRCSKCGKLKPSHRACPHCGFYR